MSDAVATLAELIRRRTGNVVPPARHGFLAEVAARRARAAGRRSTEEYVWSLAALPSLTAAASEWDSLIALVTIKESYLFRAPQQFEAIEKLVLPRLQRARAATRRLRFWSAACARGEEPVSLAMLLAATPALEGWDWHILATDLDGEALGGARRGLYGERAVALVPPPLLARYTVRRGKLFEVAPEILARIDYRPLNLAAPPFGLTPGDFDLILMRNVLIYFDRELQNRVMAHVASLLNRKGALFLGASETLWQVQDELEPVDLGSCYCYRHRRGPAGASAASQPGCPSHPLDAGDHAEPPPAAPPAVPPVGGAPPLEAAVAPAPRRADASRRAVPTAGALDPAPALPPASAAELLIEAGAHLAANEVEAARRALEAALALDPSEPAAHMLEGFLHDLGGRTEEAAASYRAALYLDPALFQVRLLLADSLQRLGQAERAAHQYREILATIEGRRERSLVLFAGLPLADRDGARERCRRALAGR